MSVPCLLKLIKPKLNTRRVINKNLIIKIKNSIVILQQNVVLMSNYYICTLTETWLVHDGYISLNEATPPSHINSHIPQEFG